MEQVYYENIVSKRRLKQLNQVTNSYALDS